MKPQSDTGKARRAAITELATRPEGLRLMDLKHLGVKPTRHVCEYWVTIGELHRVTRNSRFVLYFTHKADALTFWQEGDTLLSNPRRAEEAEQSPYRKAKKSRSNPFATAVMPAHTVFEKNAEIVTTAKTVYTLCPAYRPRFEAIDLPFKFAMQSGRCTAGSYESPSPAD